MSDNNYIINTSKLTKFYGKRLGIEAGHMLVLVGLVLVFFVASIPVFTRRDIAV